MSNSVYGIALSGLNVARAGISTTSNNIANANTVGYNRQETIVSARESNFVGGAFIGQGVDIETVRRVYSEFMSTQQQAAASDAAFFQAKYDQVQRLDRIIADDASGLSSALTNFFSAAQTLSTAPSDLSARQNFLSASEALASRFNAVNGVMDGIRTAINSRVSDTVDNVNNLTRQIADLNAKIVKSSNQAFTNSLPNDLLDKRDELIGQLNEQIQITPVRVQDGNINLFLTNGQPLVVGDGSFNITVQEDPSDRENLIVGALVPDGGSNVLIGFEPGTLGKGALSGLLEFRENELAEYQNTLGLLAAKIGSTVNELQARGVDLINIEAGNPNQPGGPIFGFRGSTDFSDPTANLQAISKVSSNTTNTGTGVLTLQNADFSKLSGRDYEIKISDLGVAQYRVKGSDASFQNLPSPSATDIANGFTGTYIIPDTDASGSAILSFDISAGVANRDGFTIYPTREAAKNIFVAMTNPAEISAAVRNGQSTSIDPNAPVIKTRNAEQGDNDGALLFADLQNARAVLQGGGSRGVSLGNAFNQIVSKIGNKTREYEIATESRQAVLNQATELRDGFSGVNMDEEAAQLIRYQQAYQASGRVISLSKEMFELVLGIFS